MRDAPPPGLAVAHTPAPEELVLPRRNAQYGYRRGRDLRANPASGLWA